MAQPIDVGGFGGQGFVLAAQHVPQPFNCVGQIHNGASLAGRVGHRRSKLNFNKRSGASINDPAVDDFEADALKIKGLHNSGLWVKLF